MPSSSSSIAPSPPCLMERELVELETVIWDGQKQFDPTLSNHPAKLTRNNTRTSLDEDHKTELRNHRKILSDLRLWDSWDRDRLQSLSKFLLSNIGIPPRPPCPSHSDLLSLARYHFPPRYSLQVDIWDFGEGRAEYSHTTLEAVQQSWKEKPEWAQVRWVHVPLGPGLIHSVVGQLFVSEGPGFRERFKHAGQSLWPSLEFEVLNFRNSSILQDQRDALYLLSQFSRVNRELNSLDCIGDENLELQTRVAWTAQSRGVSSNFWQLVQPDIPWKLSEGVRSGPPDRESEKQFLSRHPIYTNASLVLDPFHCFHRSDGFLLTLSATAGVNYLDSSLSKRLQVPVARDLRNAPSSVLTSIHQRFSSGGTKRWPTTSVEWLLIYIITEFESTPHTLFGRGTVPEIQDAYRPVVRDLKQRRTSQFRRHESVRLVRDYVACIEEISQIISISNRKLDFLERLRQDCVALHLDNDINVDDPVYEMTAVQRIDWAVDLIKKNYSRMQRIRDDLKLSLDILFQLRTMEQNELAILAESNNKAILVFTAVTIVFLPLSFFTSYFGMNLQGVVNTTKTESYFWAVCGSIAILIISFTFLYGFRNRIEWLIWGRIRRQKEESRLS